MNGLESFIPIILIFVIMYFLLIRPQQKKIKEHKIDPTLGWNFAEVEEISENSLSIKAKYLYE